MEGFWSPRGSFSEPCSLDFRAHFGRIIAAMFFLRFAVLGSVWLRARAGKPEERERRNARETLPAPTARRGRAAGEQGHKRLYWIAVWRLSLVLPLLRCCFSWCWRFGSLCSCCSRCSCRSCGAAPHGAGALALPVLAALAALAFLAVLAALALNALPVPR